ncbi:hypothetical protein ACLESD_42310 [Pyxidicoccus sp. 3LFB2]
MSPPNPTRRPHAVKPQSWPTWLATCALALTACAPSEDGQDAAVTETRRQPVDLASIDAARQLLVTDVSVVDDTFYTQWTQRTAAEEQLDGDASSPGAAGGWSFGRLIDNMLPQSLYQKYKDKGRSLFVLRWLRTWEVDQHINGQRVPARPLIGSLVIDPWRAASGCTGSDEDCQLDFSKAPFRLLAIVYRPDLRKVPSVDDPGRAGEGRFIFGVIGPDGARKPFTVIFEYALPISKKVDILTWADRYQALGQYPFGAEYNAKLFAVTNEFTKRNAAPHQANGSALLQLRTNEIPLSPADPQEWELREFVIGSSGFLTPDTVKQEVDAALNGSQALGDWAAQNASAILDGTHEVPVTWQGAPFLAAAAPVPEGGSWQVPGVTEDVRHAFALATCSGCHKAETGANFLHVRTREVGTASPVSAFLAGELAAGARVADFHRLLNVADAEQIQSGKRRDHGHK